jgi:hypothetical protein
MILVLNMVKIDHALDKLPVIINEMGYGPSEGEDHLACGPVIVGIGDFQLDILLKVW